ncbi:LysM peptidoglycan-binding domain-containing protein [Brevibacillus fulvus]|uniref:Stage VI sporulation protein D n=1 Tax=Brevibacillus fulvus TaxID=1125967 RepID=A0A938Y048_9BACL|nr:stage VI sporulation protein D [Brevibacillus fulvus]
MAFQDDLLSFHIKETVFLSSDKAGIAQLKELELLPVVEIIQGSEEISITGWLHLNGKYEPTRSANKGEAGGSDTLVSALHFSPFSIEQNQTSDFLFQSELAISHRIPVNISIPVKRIELLENVYAIIDGFDYQVESANQLKIMAELKIAGIRLREETPKATETAPAEEWEFVHVADEQQAERQITSLEDIERKLTAIEQELDQQQSRYQEQSDESGIHIPAPYYSGGNQLNFPVMNGFAAQSNSEAQQEERNDRQERFGDISFASDSLPSNRESSQPGQQANVEPANFSDPADRAIHANYSAEDANEAEQAWNSADNVGSAEQTERREYADPVQNAEPARSIEPARNIEPVRAKDDDVQAEETVEPAQMTADSVPVTAEATANSDQTAEAAAEAEEAEQIMAALEAEEMREAAEQAEAAETLAAVDDQTAALEETIAEKKELKVAISSKASAEAKESLNLTSIFSGSRRAQATTEPQQQAQAEGESDPSAQSASPSTAEAVSNLSSFVKSNEERFSKMRLCIVQRNETLETIASRYALPVSKILEVNRLASDRLEEGQILYIPQ